MRVDVAGPQLLGPEDARGPFWTLIAEIHHHGDIGLGPRFHRALHGRPSRSGVVRELDAHDQALVLERHVRGGRGLHIGTIVLELRATHAVAYDVEKCQDARLRAVDDPLFEVLEIPPAGAARVGHRRYTHAKRESVRIHTVVARIGIALARPGIRVDVHIHQPGRHVETGGVDGLDRVFGIEMRRDGRNLAVPNGDVPNRADPVLGVDYMAPLEQQVVTGLRIHLAGQPQENREECRNVPVSHINSQRKLDRRVA